MPIKPVPREVLDVTTEAGAHSSEVIPDTRARHNCLISTLSNPYIAISLDITACQAGNHLVDVEWKK